MARIDETTKARRLERIYLLLKRHTLGLTEMEIAEELQLERRTTNNYLRELEQRGKVFKDGIYWLPLARREESLRSFDLTPEEAVVLYLGARLLVKMHDKRNEPAESALFKLAAALQSDVGVGREIEQAAHELAGRTVQPGYQPIFREVVRGYLYRKKVALVYQPLHAARPFRTLFATYLLEPSPMGFATYLIGYSEAAHAIRAYKLERVQEAHITREEYSIPPDFPGLEILRNSWSIVLGEKCVQVELRFSPQVRNRVLETRWHLSQEVEEDLEQPGWLRWRIQVADTLDMVPWIRSWGADCEVLRPLELRETLMGEARLLAERYGWRSPASQPGGSTTLEDFFGER